MNKDFLCRRRFLCHAMAFLSSAMLFGSNAVAATAIGNTRAETLPSFISPHGWSREAWSAALPIFNKILCHPFIMGLADGSLPPDVFSYYIQQDAIYLEGYARTMSAIAMRLPKSEQRDLMTGFIKDTLAVERYMHELYKGMHEKHLPPTPAKASPTCQMYMSYEARIATTAPVEVACAVILPCFTIYQQVGAHLLNAYRKKDNPYKDWIESYADPAFHKATLDAVSLCDDLAAAATSAVRKQMTEVYTNATRMEWMFWDSAWKKECWPV